MNKSTKIVKKLLALFLVVLMSIESFGAIVSDNDGSAFITKAEFDSKVNEFNTEINRYETSIDAKLQGAISSYVEGVRIQDKPTTLFDRLKDVIGGMNPYFFNDVLSGDNALTSNIIISRNKNYSVHYVKSVKISTPKKLMSFVFTSQNSESTARQVSIIGWKDTTNNQNIGTFINAYEWAKIVVPAWESTKINYALSASTSYPSSWTEKNPGDTVTLDWSSWSKTSGNIRYFHYKWPEVARGQPVTLVTASSTDSYASGAIESAPSTVGKAQPAASETTETSTFNLNNLITSSTSRAGSGSQWAYELNPDGSKSLKRYWSTFYPQQNITLNYKTYKDYGTKTSVAQNDLKDDTTCVYTPSITPAYGKVAVGTNHTSYSTANKVGYCEEIFSLINSSTDTNDYRTAQWGNNTTGNIYVSTESPTLVNKSNNIPNALTDLDASTVSIGGVTHTTTKVTNNIKEVTINPETVALNTFVNSYYTGVAGETVKMGYGIPIMMTNADNSTRYTITLGVKQTVAPAGTTVASGNVTARLSMNHFVNGGFATSADRLYEGTISCNSSGVGTATFTVDNIGKGQQLWLNLYGNTASRKVELTSFNVTMS
ncbi:MAG: hypothetical protein IJ593_03985 [Lachnospiraceae bacterium]|nr:hypothetical protein [Lachnospiraceae bacterium]